MKKLIYLLIIILFFGCASKKAVTQSNIQQKADVQNAIADTKASQVETKKTVVDQSNTDIETVTTTTNYDTSKPADPGTGKSPVASETVKTEKKIEKADVKTDVVFAKKDESTHADNSQAKTQSDKKIKTSETKTSDVKYWYYIFLIAGIAIAIFLIRKYIKPIKTFFSMIFRKV